MQRDTILELARWKDKQNRKPLLVTGVRQCGKTYVLKAFGAQYFEDTAYINFEGNKDVASIFSLNFDVARIVDELSSIILGKKIVPGKTLLIFDEIQECPLAITALKYFFENMPDLHIICAGSLLGVELKAQGVSFPVGKVERLFMFPMSFKEFVIADGGGALLEGLEKLDKLQALPLLYTARLEKYLQLYYIIGGMPEVVQTWVNTHDFARAEAVQDMILADYESDFSKHAPAELVPRIRAVWLSVPKQLAKENNKFIFSHVKEGARAKDFEEALEWLCDAGLTYKLELVTEPELPLSFCADASYYKVYMNDVGLLRRKSNVYYKTILDGDENYIRFKGALTENFVLTELKNQNLPMYFWRSDNTAEVDFVTEWHGHIIPLEAKSADNTRAKSLRTFVSKYKPAQAFKLSLKNIGANPDGATQVISLPLYVAYRAREYME